MEMLTLRNTLKDLAIVESEARRLERLAENVKMAMDDYCRAAAQMLTDDDLQLSQNDQKALIRAIRLDTHQITLHWGKTRHVSRWGFEWAHDEGIDDTDF